MTRTLYDFALNRKETVDNPFNFTYRYINDNLSINNRGFKNYLGPMYPNKDTTESNTSASNLDLLLSIGRSTNTLPFMTNANTM